MFQIYGRIVTVETLPNGNFLMRVRREQRGLVGHEIALLVPPLVFARDGRPKLGETVEIGAQSINGAGSAAMAHGPRMTAVHCALGREAGDVTTVAPDSEAPENVSRVS